MSEKDRSTFADDEDTLVTPYFSLEVGQQVSETLILGIPPMPNETLVRDKLAALDAKRKKANIQETASPVTRLRFPQPLSYDLDTWLHRMFQTYGKEQGENLYRNFVLGLKLELTQVVEYHHETRGMKTVMYALGNSQIQVVRASSWSGLLLRIQKAIEEFCVGKRQESFSQNPASDTEIKLDETLREAGVAAQINQVLKQQ
ncbi:MAG: hypothetical protein U0519_03500 [Candidatus Gracilibacteria bacterium]